MGSAFHLIALSQEQYHADLCFHRIQSIVLVEPFRLRAVFTDGVQKEYDLRRWKDHPAFSILFRHPALQTAVRLEPGGYGVSWNDNIDLAAEEIYYNGIDCETPDHVCGTEPGNTTLTHPFRGYFHT